ncbi:unnamed protein product [Cylicostephanus goldi]|uniref:WW domain-containing protein n=1 Tax=Cylicostephanus goldi TaxID=71465 RepID=A0A3P6QFK3_CYLGO|nr:unnamed protein product [Cylicostephanus goldi]
MNLVSRWKYVPERIEHDHFMNLPEGWTRITHNSGMPVYLHRKSRVVSLSKPYFIGTQGVRDHPIPVTGIPCLHQRRIMERDAALAAEAERQKKDENEAPEATLENEIKQKLIAPAVKIEVCGKARMLRERKLRGSIICACHFLSF